MPKFGGTIMGVILKRGCQNLNFLIAKAIHMKYSG